MTSPPVVPNPELYKDITEDSPTHIMDWATFLEFMGGDMEIIDELLAIYKDDSKRLMGELSSSSQARDFDQLAIDAHSLKGASANIQAGWVRHWATLLEAAAKHKDSGTIDYAVYELTKAYQQLLEAFDQSS